jgi:hypothetical protein
MNTERNIDDEVLEMWNRVKNAVITTTTKIKKVVYSETDKRFRDVEERVVEHDGVLSAIKRGILNIAGSFDKKK